MPISIIALPAASAASRATLPALWPWRTSQSRAGHLCLMAETKRERRESSEEAFDLQPPPQALRIGEEVRLHAHRFGALDVDLAVVDEQSFGGLEAEAIECAIVERRIRLHQFLLA